jgi:hypothetical protein
MRPRERRLSNGGFQSELIVGRIDYCEDIAGLDEIPLARCNVGTNSLID